VDFQLLVEQEKIWVVGARGRAHNEQVAEGEAQRRINEALGVTLE
jgi:hypothetical protein